ncbi:MAG: hypothetical protein M1819_001284 [Sarea resinae]|nr:MAG: hypothetical protein M1819_001284 [Sarea resinae]
MKPYIAVPAVAALVYRAWSRKSLTPLGIVVATVTAVVHVIHPWSVCFALLVVFFLAGTAVTKVKHDVKSRLTQSASGASGGEGSRTHIQVLANSLVASVLILLHARELYRRDTSGAELCFSAGREDILFVGIVANYAAVAADTFSSELGILSRSPPRLLTSPTFRTVPPGTNGGVTLIGTLAGFLGALTIALTTLLLTPWCANPSTSQTSTSTPATKALVVLFITVWGALGSLLDSFLGGTLQASVLDIRTNKIVEGEGGHKVLVPSASGGSMHYQKLAEVKSRVLNGEGAGSIEHIAATAPASSSTTTGSADTSTAANVARRRVADSEREKGDEEAPSRTVVSGWGLLDNNGVNFLMALLMSLGGMGVAAAAFL